MNTFFAIKRDQTHTYDKNGKRLFVTRLLTEPMPVVMIKNVEKDKYNALQVAMGKKSRINKPETGHLKVADLKPKFLREIRLKEASDFKTGDQVNIDTVLTVGDEIKITSMSKGK